MCIFRQLWRGHSLCGEWLRKRGRGAGRDRRWASEGEVDVIKVVEGRGRGLKKGVVSPCVQAGAAHWKGRRRGRKEEEGRVSYHGNTTLLERRWWWRRQRQQPVNSCISIPAKLRVALWRKVVLCLYVPNRVPKETEEEEPVLFGRLWFVVGCSN